MLSPALLARLTRATTTATTIPSRSRIRIQRTALPVEGPRRDVGWIAGRGGRRAGGRRGAGAGTTGVVGSSSVRGSFLVDSVTPQVVGASESSAREGSRPASPVRSPSASARADEYRAVGSPCSASRTAVDSVSGTSGLYELGESGRSLSRR